MLKELYYTQLLLSHPDVPQHVRNEVNAAIVCSPPPFSGAHSNETIVGNPMWFIIPNGTQAVLGFILDSSPLEEVNVKEYAAENPTVYYYLRRNGMRRVQRCLLHEVQLTVSETQPLTKHETTTWKYSVKASDVKAN